MIVRVQVDHREYVVEIIDLKARPVVAVIEDERFEIWPEEVVIRQPVNAVDFKMAIDHNGNGYAQNLAPQNPAKISSNTQATKSAEHQPANGRQVSPADGAVRSPLPGIIISVVVKPGDQVHTGQQLCVLEAMKMNNSILASHSGTITKVNIHPGQPVRARDVLLEITN